MTKARAIGASILFGGMILGAGCTIKSPDDSEPSGGSGGNASAAGNGGRAAQARAGAGGKTSSGGHGGSGKSGEGSSGDAGETGLGGDSNLSGAGGEGGTADPCAACPNDTCLPTGECVACLASNDHCPDGQYCTDNNECASGCKNDASCASGVCSAQHDCQSCLKDQECSAPQVCGDNRCAPACTAANEGTSTGCGSGLTCCSLHCVDATTDAAHCGACGTACAEGQFCGVTGCHASTLTGLCSVAKAVVVLDGVEGNETPGRAIAAALKAQCNPAPTVREVSQTVADVVNTTNGRPVAGGDELLVATGGTYFAHLTDYVSKEPISPIYETKSAAGAREYRAREGDRVIATFPLDGSSDAHDYFVIQFMRDPTSGSLVLNAQGFWQTGTTAAAFYFDQAIMPSLATLDKAWYVYEWTDADLDMAPDLNEITLVDSGL